MYTSTIVSTLLLTFSQSNSSDSLYKLSPSIILCSSTISASMLQSFYSSFASKSVSMVVRLSLDWVKFARSQYRLVRSASYSMFEFKRSGLLFLEIYGVKYSSIVNSNKADLSMSWFSVRFDASLQCKCTSSKNQITWSNSNVSSLLINSFSKIFNWSLFKRFYLLPNLVSRRACERCKN